MAVEFGTAKTVLILAIVVGCFAVLWPKLFYPMLQASVNPQASGDSQACCDVLFENDVNAIKVITELCGNILHHYDEFDPTLTQAFSQGKLTKDIVNTCRNEVLNTCGIDITSFLNEKVRLGKSYKQILDEIRSFNSSICLKVNFGVNLGSLGAPRRMRLGALSTPKHYRQERPPHLRPDMLHPALRERGRAIPQSHIVPRTVEKEPRPPIPGMRPPMGGPGHVVPPPKGSSTMGIIMPIYTIGIVIFFMYTIMKVMFKKPGDTSSSYAEFAPDPEFRKIVFESYGESSYDDGVRQRSKHETGPLWKSKEDSTKLGDIEIDHLRRRLEETEAAMERIVAQMGSVPRKLHSSSGTNENRAKEDDKLRGKSEIDSSLKESYQKSSVAANESQEPKPTAEETILTTSSTESQVYKEVTQKLIQQAEPTTEEEQPERPSSRAEESAKVKVMGMETTASCECGHRWSRPSTPILGIPGHSHSRSSTPVPPPTPEPQAIYLEGSLPSQSKLLVSDAETQALALDREDIEEDSDPPVILSGKMTLSLISLDAALAAEDEQLRQQHGGKSILAEAEVAASGVSEIVRASTQNIEKDVEEEEDEEEEEEEDREEEEEAEAEENDENYENAGGEHNVSEEEKKSEERKDVPLVNDTQHDLDDTPSATNYTTASAAAEATNATGTEETAADFSAMESFGLDDEQQEDLEVEEEVWNGDVHSGEEDDQEEGNVQHIANIHHH